MAIIVFGIALTVVFYSADRIHKKCGMQVLNEIHKYFY